MATVHTAPTHCSCSLSPPNSPRKKLRAPHMALHAHSHPFCQQPQGEKEGASQAPRNCHLFLMACPDQVIST